MIAFRPANQHDIPYVLDSFTHTMADSVFAEGLARIQIRQLLVSRLESADNNLTIAFEQDVPDEILGYVVWRSPMEIHYVQVKHLYKRLGIATQLLQAIGASKGTLKVTFIPSPEFSRAARQHGYRLLHRPWQP